MARIRKPELLPSLLLLLVSGIGSVGFSSWLPLIGAIPWVAGIAWFARSALLESEFPSAAEAARQRLWAR